MGAMLRIMDAADGLRQKSQMAVQEDDAVLLARIREIYQQQGTPMEESLLQQAFEQVHGRYPVFLNQKSSTPCHLCGTAVASPSGTCSLCSAGVLPSVPLAHARVPASTRAPMGIWVHVVALVLALAVLIGMKEAVDAHTQGVIEARMAAEDLNFIAEQSKLVMQRQLKMQQLKYRSSALDNQIVTNEEKIKALRAQEKTPP